MAPSPGSRPRARSRSGPGPRGADPGPLCYGKRRHRADGDGRSRVPRPGPAPPARRARSRSTPRPRRDRRQGAAPTSSASTPSARADRDPGDQRVQPEQRHPAAHRQARAGRAGLPPVTFGGSGPLLACRLIDILGLPSVIVPRDPGQRRRRSGCSRWTSRTTTSVRTSPATVSLGKAVEDLPRPGASGGRRPSTARASPTPVYQRSADLRYYGQAYEVRVPAPCRRDRRASGRPRWSPRFHEAHEKLYGYAYRDDPRHGGRMGQPARLRHRPHHPAGPPSACRRRPATGAGHLGPSGLLRRGDPRHP